MIPVPGYFLGMKFEAVLESVEFPEAVLGRKMGLPDPLTDNFILRAHATRVLRATELELLQYDDVPITYPLTGNSGARTPGFGRTAGHSPRQVEPSTVPNPVRYLITYLLPVYACNDHPQHADCTKPVTCCQLIKLPGACPP